MSEQVFNLRVTFATPPQGGGPASAMAARIRPSARMAKAISNGLGDLARYAALERFTGKGPFPASMRKLGNVTGRLKRDLIPNPPEAVIQTPTGYRSRIGSKVEYFAIHEFGFNGTVSVRAHSRAAYTVKKRGSKRAGTLRGNYSVLPQSVRAHSKMMKIPARMPLATAINEKGAEIIGIYITRVATTES